MSRRSPSWEVVDLVANRFDGKTLALASCVCKSWYDITLPELLWEKRCTTDYPYLSALKLVDPAAVTYRRLYAMAHVASVRRAKPVPKPRISLNDLTFIVDVYSKKTNCHIVKMLKPCKELELENDIFRFNIETGNENVNFSGSGVIIEEVKMTWSVVYGCEGMFNMMDCDGKLSLCGGLEGCFSDELPSPGCCGGGVSSGIVADLKLGLSKKRDENGRFKVEKVSVGMLSVVNWRYLTIDDGLRYLQHFILSPCNNIIV
ncbi:hypothetical protein ACFE04_029335 [Oxalis oulophora]